MTTDIYIVRADYVGGSKDLMATTSSKQADSEVLRLINEKLDTSEARFVSVQSAIDEFLNQNPEPSKGCLALYDAWCNAFREFSNYQHIKAETGYGKQWPDGTRFYVVVVPFKG